MKKIISFIIICFVSLMGLTATIELTKLRQQIETLEIRISTLEKADNSMESPTLTEKTTSNSTEIAESLESDNPDNLLKIALYDTIEDNLLIVAKKCANLGYYNTNEKNEEKQVEIANALSENSGSTNAVMMELVASIYPDVWKTVAYSEKSSEDTLLEVAKKCASLNYYNTNEKNEEKQVEIAYALSENSESTNAVMMELVASIYPDVWEIVAYSEKSSEDTLLEVAKKCANLDYYNTNEKDEEKEKKQVEIAYALSENSESTDAVMMELVASIYPDVWKAVAYSEKSSEDTLLEVAKKCTNLDYYNTNEKNEEKEKKQVEIANALSENSKSTDAVMMELVASIYPDVWKAVAYSEKSSEDTLLKVAKKCANLDYYNTNEKNEEKQVEIANALSENSRTTNAVMMELESSEYAKVISIAHQWIEQ